MLAFGSRKVFNSVLKFLIPAVLGNVKDEGNKTAYSRKD